MTDASGTTTFTYDALGRRIRTAGPGGTTQYVLDGANVVADADANGNYLRFYNYYDGVAQLHSMTQGGTNYFYQRDLTGNVMGLIRQSDGAIAAAYDYTAFGETTASEPHIANRFRFASGEQDATGLYYFRNRYYDPALRRWISEDPIGLAGGLNWYAYVGNNPISQWDPWGLQEECPEGATMVNGECSHGEFDPGTITVTVSPTRLIHIFWSNGAGRRFLRDFAFGARELGRAGSRMGSRISAFLSNDCVEGAKQDFDLGRSEAFGGFPTVVFGAAAGVLTGEVLGGTVKVPKGLHLPRPSHTWTSALRAKAFMNPTTIARLSYSAAGKLAAPIAVVGISITGGKHLGIPVVCAVAPGVYE